MSYFNGPESAFTAFQGEPKEGDIFDVTDKKYTVKYIDGMWQQIWPPVKVVFQTEPPIASDPAPTEEECEECKVTPDEAPKPKKTRKRTVTNGDVLVDKETGKTLERKSGKWVEKETK